LLTSDLGLAQGNMIPGGEFVVPWEDRLFYVFPDYLAQAQI